MYYSAKNKAFIDDPASYPNWDLSDLSEISAEDYAALLRAPSIDWSSGAPMPSGPILPSDEQLAAAVRVRRDTLLRTVYDPAVAMLQRSLRLGNEASAAKLAEFDAWAVALQNVPEQPGFPHTIDWPEQPTAEAL